MKKKLIYITPSVKLVQVVLEKGFVVNTSAIPSVNVQDWEPAGIPHEESERDIWLPF